MTKEYPPCPTRSNLTFFRADGSTDRAQRCIEQEAPTANQDVLPVDCLECPLRIYLVTDSGRYQPPTRKLPNGAAPKPDSGGNGFVACGLRIVVAVPGCCGSSHMARVCDNNECQYYLGEVSPEICAVCTARTP